MIIPSTTTAPTCLCGRPMVLRYSDRFGTPTRPVRGFFGCTGFPACRETCGAHPDGTPSSSPADAETRQARIAAHDEFDKLWKSGRMGRGTAYKRMQKLMGMSRDEAHIGFFSKEQCERLISLLRGMRL